MNLKRALVRLSPVALVVLGVASDSFSAVLAPERVRETVRQAASVHLTNPSSVHVCSWIIAPLYDGLLRAGFATGEASLVAAVLEFGQQAGWTPGFRVYNADDHAVGHAWLDLFLLDPTRTERLRPFKERFDHVLAHPITEALNDFSAVPETLGVDVMDRWTWSDALYMAPPTLVRLHAATGDGRYLEFLDREYRFTYERLYDKEHSLFYRDSRFAGRTNGAGRRTFWSRGNGWVYGGLALVLEHLPVEHASRPFYEQLFREMSAAVLRSQQPGGLWHPNLDDPGEIPVGEASGSGFFVFGLAWGINHGLLDRARHWPAVERGWRALVDCIRPDGMIGYVQPVGAAPDRFGPLSIQDYGTGAFLLAGAEVLRALGGATEESPRSILARAETAVEAAIPRRRAYARLVPERKDDLAWENDKVAFRVYGPALRSGVEDSGIDVWAKRVPYPIINRWYPGDIAGGLSYHKDNGEGFDGYRVGATRGCGGVGLWETGQLITSDTYLVGRVHWTRPEIAEFSTVYRYPMMADGRAVYEHRVTRLRLGERLAEIEVYFAAGAGHRPAPLEGFDPEVAIGLVGQTAAARLIARPEGRKIATWEVFGRGYLGTGVTVDGTVPLRTVRFDAGDQPQILILARLGSDRRLRYRTGFAWSEDGEIVTEDAWIAHLEAKVEGSRR